MDCAQRLIGAYSAQTRALFADVQRERNALCARSAAFSVNANALQSSTDSLFAHCECCSRRHAKGCLDTSVKCCGAWHALWERLLAEYDACVTQGTVACDEACAAADNAEQGDSEYDCAQLNWRGEWHDKLYAFDALMECAMADTVTASYRSDAHNSSSNSSRSSSKRAAHPDEWSAGCNFTEDDADTCHGGCGVDVHAWDLHCSAVLVKWCSVRSVAALLMRCKAASRAVPIGNHCTLLQMLLYDQRLDQAHLIRAIYSAAGHGCVEVVDQLLNFDARFDSSCVDARLMKHAAYYGHVGVFERLLQDPRAHLGDSVGEQFRIAAQAADAGAPEIVRMLVFDSRVTGPSAGGRPPLVFWRYAAIARTVYFGMS